MSKHRSSRQAPPLSQGGTPPAAAMQEMVGLFNRGQWEPLEAQARGTTTRFPGHPFGWTILGAVLLKTGRLSEAAEAMARGIELSPRDAVAHANLGLVLKDLGRLDEAEAGYRRALALRPDYAEALSGLGLVFKLLGRLDEAEVCYRHALALKPEHPEFHNDLGVVLKALGRLDEAEACYRRALALRPEYPEAHSNLASILLALGRLDEAEAGYRRALALRPGLVEAFGNLGTTLQHLGRLDEAEACYRHALALKPDYPEARWGDCLLHLLRGDFEAGWTRYEWRWRRKKAPPHLPFPHWNGGPLDSGRLLLWGEQGVGDEVMFAGLIPDALRTGNRCVLDCAERLKPLFARSFPTLEVVSGLALRPEPPPPALGIAAHLPTGDLARLFRPNAEAFSATTSPFLVADSDRRARLRERYADGRLLVGLAWHTDNADSGRIRSIALRTLAPLFAVPAVRWISLQYGAPKALENQIAAAGLEMLLDAEIDQLADLDGFAAQISALDLVITIDNSTAHFAGALGVPTWTMLPVSPDWRWLLERGDSPWYPAMRLFRQPKAGDWDGVAEQVAAALRELRDAQPLGLRRNTPGLESPPERPRMETTVFAPRPPAPPPTFHIDWGLHTLMRLLSSYQFDTVLDIGSGESGHAGLLRYQGKTVTTIDLHRDADIVGDFVATKIDRTFDVVWCCHVLEHQRNVGMFLDKIATCLKDGGILALTVPAHPPERLVAGHIAPFNSGLLCYNLIMSGFNCKNAIILVTNDLGLIVRKEMITLPKTECVAASGNDISRHKDIDIFLSISEYFPFPVTQGSDCAIKECNWGGTHYLVPNGIKPFTVTSRFLKEPFRVGLY